MSFYTQLFLVNWVLLLSTAWIDRKLLDDALERIPGFLPLLGLWFFLSVGSIPAWLIYIIVTW